MAARTHAINWSDWHRPSELVNPMEKLHAPVAVNGSRGSRFTVDRKTQRSERSRRTGCSRCAGARTRGRPIDVVRRFAFCSSTSSRSRGGCVRRGSSEHRLRTDGNVLESEREPRCKRPSYFRQPRALPVKIRFPRERLFRLGVLDDGRYASECGHHAEDVFRHQRQAQRRREQDALPNRRLRWHRERKVYSMQAYNGKTRSS